MNDQALKPASKPAAIADDGHKNAGPGIDAHAHETDGFQLVIDALKLNGIDTIFGLPGIPITDLTRRMQKNGLRVISFRHEQNAGYAASIAGFLTQKPGICLTVSAPGLPERPHRARARDGQLLPDDPDQRQLGARDRRPAAGRLRGDGPARDREAAVQGRVPRAARRGHRRRRRARDPRGAVGPPGRRLPRPAGEAVPAGDRRGDGASTLIKVVDPAPKQIPAPDAVKRALDLLKSAKKPLIILGKGAAYAQADADIKALVEKTGIPYLPMSMAKGLLPDTHEQCASRRARTCCPSRRRDADRRAAQLAALARQGQDLGRRDVEGVGRPEVRAGRHLAAGGRQQRAHRRAGRRRHRLVRRRRCCRHRRALAEAARRVDGGIAERKQKNVAKMAETLAKNPSPMSFQSALNVVRDIVKANPDAILVNEGANALDFTRSIVDMYKPRKRIDVGTWGIMGIGMGYCVAAAAVTGQQVIAVEGDSAFGFSGMETETICRYGLPVCVVIMNNNGVYRGDETNPTGGADPSPLVFVKDARYEKLMEAFGGVGAHVKTPDELRRAMEEAIRSKRPTLINAVIDEGGGTESGRITSLNPTAKKK
jgi:oxalyl-CoA decarboxylase